VLVVSRLGAYAEDHRVARIAAGRVRAGGGLGFMMVIAAHPFG
jgi:hypothetical protein